ncbi:hypothetical protein F4801DRAFT_124943 [Xylaria longipes]|nr:hypothetical protein F4801DRAFT_124943 [Xylaria longipes]RYC65744.1 hypothetical protein CHU98_g436 [Xylaria longipes]
MAPSCLFLFLSILGLRIHPALGAIPRFGAFNDATLLPFDDGSGFAPRWYMGTPALPAQPLSPNPRHGLGGHRLGARQDVSCAAGQHSCVEANSPGTCCENDRYCYLNKDWQPMCCHLGVQCPDSECGADLLYCNQTLSTTVAIATTSAGQQQGDTAVTSFVSRTTTAACCNRACKETAFSCEKAFGGQCCSYNYKCASNSKCIADPAPSTPTSVSTIVPEIPPGCTISQITCAQTEGGGCCNSGSICTFQSIATASSAAVCAPDPTLSDSGSSNALSSGARAGIGVGVAVGAAIVIAAVTWLCIRRRHRQRSGTIGTASVSAHEMRYNMAAEQATGGARSGVGDQDMGDSLLVGPMTPWTLRSGFSDANGAALPGHGYDYIGPDAIEGPFTDRGGDGHPAFDPMLATTPPTASGDGAPYHPDHILRPVEIGTGEAQKDIEGQKENGHLADTEEMPVQDVDPTAGRFELMGSLGTPSPLNSDELSQPTDKGPPSSSPTGDRT